MEESFFEVNPAKMRNLDMRESAWQLNPTGSNSDTFNDFLRFYRETERNKIKGIVLEVQGLSKVGLEEAIKFVNGLRMEMGLPEVKNMKDGVFAYKPGSVTFGGEVSFDGLNEFGWGLALYAIDDNRPAYVQAGVAAHELVHQHLEYKAIAYSVENMEGELSSFGMIRFGQAREGLAVTDIKTGKSKKNIVNEIGNYLLETRFMEKLLRQKQFAEERNEKKLQLKKYKKTKEGKYMVNWSDETEKATVLFDEENMCFEKDGSLIHLSLSLQLAKEVEKLVPEVGGEPVLMVIMRAKLDPKRTNELYSEMKKQMGAELFGELIELPYNSPEYHLKAAKFIEKVQNIKDTKN